MIVSDCFVKSVKARDKELSTNTGNSAANTQKKDEVNMTVANPKAAVPNKYYCSLYACTLYM